MGDFSERKFSSARIGEALMNIGHDSLKSCKSYIECQFRETESKTNEVRRPFVTISRQAGAGGIAIGRILSDYLRRRDKSAKCFCAWTVFDKNLVAEVIKTYNLPERLQKFMNEEKISEMDDILGELFRLHPAKWTLVQKTSRTILHLAQLGYVILVGRGANVVTHELEGGFHVRLVGSLEKRLKHLQEYYGFNALQAAEFLKTEDEGRKSYLKNYFGKNIDDPLLYDLVINTDFISYDNAARIIGRAVLAGKSEERCLHASGKNSRS